MITIDDLIRKLEELKEQVGTEVAGYVPVLIDVGKYLAEVEDVDFGGSDEGVIIWCGDRVDL